MPRVASKNAKTPAPVRKSAGRSWDWLTRAAFFVSLVLVIVRATMPETVRGDLLPTPGVSGAPAIPGPATGLLLDLLCCIPALMILVRRLLDENFVPRVGWASGLMFLLGGWTLASTLWAGDKFIAVVNAAHWAAALVLLWSMAQLVRTWLRLRIVAAVGLGLLLVLLAQGYYYRFVDLPDLQRNWTEHRDELLRQRDLKANSTEAIQLGKNVVSGDVSGFNLSRNTYAALLVLLMLVAAGVALQRSADGEKNAGAAPVVAVLAIGLWMLYRYVQSKTAFATPAIGALVLAIVLVRRRWISRHARGLYWATVGLFAAGGAAVVGHGLKHGTLFHVSLTFRWQYWVGAARVFLHHPWLGVGWANFGPQYLTYRLRRAAEEPADPHNFLVRAFVELGVVGGALMVGWVMRLWWETTQYPTAPAASADSEKTTPAFTHSAIPFFLALSLAAIGFNAALSIDWSQSGAWVFLESFKRVMFWVVLLGGMLAAGIRSFNRPELDDRPADRIVVAMLVGLGLFLLHNLIDFSLFETGPMFVFALLAGSVLGLRRHEACGRPAGRGVVLAVFVLGAVGWIVAAGAGVWNVASAEALARDADEQVRQNHLARGRDELIEAFRLVPINADYAYRAEQAAVLDWGNPLMMRQLIDAAVNADPYSVRYRLARAELEVATNDPPSAWADYRKTLAIDPNNLSIRLEFADLLREHGQPAEAREQYEKALEFNAALAPDEIRRLSPERVEWIRRTIAALEGK